MSIGLYPIYTDFYILYINRTTIVTDLEKRFRKQAVDEILLKDQLTRPLASKIAKLLGLPHTRVVGIAHRIDHDVRENTD